MVGWYERTVQAVAFTRTRWRRARNLKAGSAAPRACVPAALRWIVALGVAAGAGGAVVITTHARQLGDAGRSQFEGDASARLGMLQAAVPGASFSVPRERGLTVARHGDAAILIAMGMRSEEPVRVNLCTQRQADGRLAPVRIGFPFEEIERMAARGDATGRPATFRNLALASSKYPDVPAVTLSGAVSADFSKALTLSFADKQARVRWFSDAGQGRLRRDGWLLWHDAALRIERRAHAGCTLGEVVVQLVRPDRAAPDRALVTAFPARGHASSAWLAPGQYHVPERTRASLEDQALFQDLLQHGLIRLTPAGLIEIAPKDLAAWQAANASARAVELSSWTAIERNPAAAKLFRRLYSMADGAYVREQVRIFNHERRLLAWRVRPALAGLEWRASVAAAPAATVDALPLAAARLFAEVPQGWGGWSRIAAWPGDAGQDMASIRLALPGAASGRERIELMLVGRLHSVTGARVAQARNACNGRACTTPAAVQVVTLVPDSGTRHITLAAAALETDLLGGDQQYRHLRVVNGTLAWRALASNSSTARRSAPAGVILHDRHGAVLWRGGAPTPGAIEAGLAPLLGWRTEHANSVAGMLARIAAPDGAPHSARLTLDLTLQRAGQQALECIGMRRGRLEGGACIGGAPAPHGRQAGLVVIDTDSGDVLAAAGAGTARVDAGNWSEVRDFDRANPDRSPLRLPALQHDGGAHRSPGSTFKVVSALGLELAAQRDPQLNALLAGMPLNALNRLARERGFAFRTNAASYPFGTRLAHITNYRDQHLDRRATDGRLGLAQALTYSLNTWFAWSGELSDASLFGRAEGGAPDLQALDTGALDSVRPIAAMAHRLGFERELRLDGGLMPAGFDWSPWDALQASRAGIDPIQTRHELRQMAIGLRMQATPLHMAMVAGAVGEGRVIAPRLMLELDGRRAQHAAGARLGVRLDRIRAGMKGVVDSGTAAAAFGAARLAPLRRGLSGKTGTAPAMVDGRELATVWFTGWLEPGSVPGYKGRLAVAAFVSHSEASGGEHAAPVVAAALGALLAPKAEQRGK